MAVRRSFLKSFLVAAALGVGAAAISPLSAATVQYQYDELGRLTRVEYSNGTVIVYTYDAAGNRTTRVITGA